MYANAITKAIIEQNGKAVQYVKTVLAAVFVYHRHNMRIFFLNKASPAKLSAPFWMLKCVRILAFKRFAGKTHLIVHGEKKKREVFIRV